jgi:site-specific DNA-methyltransferase (adenine-specific)
MIMSGHLFELLRLKGTAREVAKFAEEVGVSVSMLRHYNDHNILPTGRHLDSICRASGLSHLELMLGMGRLDSKTIELLQKHSGSIASLLNDSVPKKKKPKAKHKLVFKTDLGALYKGDCMSLLQEMPDESVDMVFADPPFNLNKLYPSNIDDNLKEEEYVKWCQDWLRECARVLKVGGSLFLWNLPKWNAEISSFLSGYLRFRNWIGVDIKYTLPIGGRLYPSHYSLLYYTKGEKPSCFKPDRLPMPTCPKCHADLKDYGGYKDKMNPFGVNISDIWLDIPPVRHAKYKRRESANELSIKLLDRVIEMSTKEGDVVFDPFGGSGTTYMAAELKNRRWIGVEIGPLDEIVARFDRRDEEQEILKSYRSRLNSLFIDEVKDARKKRGLWTDDSFT